MSINAELRQGVEAGRLVRLVPRSMKDTIQRNMYVSVDVARQLTSTPLIGSLKDVISQGVKIE